VASPFFSLGCAFFLTDAWRVRACPPERSKNLTCVGQFLGPPTSRFYFPRCAGLAPFPNHLLESESFYLLPGQPAPLVSASFKPHPTPPTGCDKTLPILLLRFFFFSERRAHLGPYASFSWPALLRSPETSSLRVVSSVLCPVLDGRSNPVSPVLFSFSQRSTRPIRDLFHQKAPHRQGRC